MFSCFLTWVKKSVKPILICIVVVAGVGAAASLFACCRTSRDLARQTEHIELALEHSVTVLAASIEDQGKSPNYIAGLAASFCAFSALDPGDGIFFKAGDTISRLQDTSLVGAMTAEERTQVASLLRQLMDASGTKTQLDLLLQLNSLMRA